MEVTRASGEATHSSCLGCIGLWEGGMALKGRINFQDGGDGCVGAGACRRSHGVLVSDECGVQGKGGWRSALTS